MSAPTYQQRWPSQGSNLDGSKTRGVSCGGHGLDTAQEHLHVLLAGSFALASVIINILSSALASGLTHRIEESPGSRDSLPPVTELSVWLISLQFL